MNIIEPYPTEEESAAAMAAIACYLAEEESPQSETIETKATPVAPPAVPAEPEKPRDPLSMMIIGPPPSEDESAAILAAISCYITEEPLELDHADEQWQWPASRVLTHQGIFPQRCPQRPTWGNVERLHRAGRGSSGIVGL